MRSLRFPAILSPESVRQIESMSVLAQQIADRWALGWPKETKLLEKQGKLLQALKEQTGREGNALSDARQRGQNLYLADHELMELYGISSRPPA